MSARVMEGAATRARARALPDDSDAPPDARTWIRGRLLELHELPMPSRVWYSFWCRVLRQPLPDFYDLRGAYGSRGRARARCRDELDYVVALPYERELGAKVAESPTFCRPLWGPHAARDAEHAGRYADDLASHFSAVSLAAFRQVVHEMEVQREMKARLL